MLPSSHKLNYLPQRPKRKERTTKRAKGCSSKPKRSCDTIDATTKLKNEIKSKENRADTSADKTFVSLLTKGRISQKVGLYRKGKVSSTIKRRKVLATIQSSSTVTPVQYQRPILDHHNQTTSTLPSSANNSVLSSCSSLFIERKPHHTGRNTSGRNSISLTSSPERGPKPWMNMSSNDGSVLSEPSSPPDDGCSMDTVDTNNVIVKVSEKIIAGLERKKSFPSSSDYLGSICSDLRKVMRQSDSKSYKQIEESFLSPYPNTASDSDSTHNSVLEICTDPIPPPSPVIEGAADDFSMIPPPLISDPSSTDYSMETNIMTTSSPIQSGYWRRPIDNSTGTAVTHFMPPLTRPPLHYHHANDSYMTDCPPSLSNSVLLSSCTVGFTSPNKRDLLDSLDEGSIDRPRMYPHKLY